MVTLCSSMQGADREKLSVDGKENIKRIHLKEPNRANSATCLKQRSVGVATGTYLASTLTIKA